MIPCDVFKIHCDGCESRLGREQLESSKQFAVAVYPSADSRLKDLLSEVGFDHTWTRPGGDCTVFIRTENAMKQSSSDNRKRGR